MAPLIIIIIVTLLLSAFFFGMEAAFACANRLKLEMERKQKGVFGYIADIFIENPGQFVTAMLTGGTIALVAFSLYTSALVRLLFDMGTGAGARVVETLVAAALFIVAGRFIPATLASLVPNAWLKVFAIPAFAMYIILYPVAKLASWLSYGIARLAGIKAGKDGYAKGFERADLENLLEENDSEVREERESEIKIFRNALDFADLRVRDCMIHRVDIEAVDADTTVEEITRRFIESQYSRIFVWEGSIDNIIGYVNLKSLFSEPRTIRDCMIPVRYAAESMSAGKLLEEFTGKKVSVAVVIDEFGGTAGIVSIEDILEEIFGEIEDEHDTPEMTEKQLSANEWVLSSRLEVEYLNAKYGMGIPESDEYDTLAGFIIYHGNGIPAAGKTVTIGDKHIRILKSSSSKLELVKMRIVR